MTTYVARKKTPAERSPSGRSRMGAATARPKTQLKFERANQAYLWLTDKGKARVVKF